MDERGHSPGENDLAILVVDDDPQVLKWVCKMLASGGASRVLPACSAAEAVSIWEKHAAQIRLLVTDFVMPEVTGDLLALRLLAERPALPVLFMSGNDPNSLDSEIPLVGGGNFIQKPFTLSEMRRSLKNLALAG